MTIFYIFRNNIVPLFCRLLKFFTAGSFKKCEICSKVVNGQNLVHKIEYTKRNYYNERPVQDVTIVACGQLPLTKPYYVASQPYTFWAYVKAIVPPLSMSLAILGTFQWIMNRLDAGCRYG